MAAEWYYTTNKTQMGPVSWSELRELAGVGILKPHDMVWSDGMDEWVKAINQGGLFAEEAAVDTSVRKKKSAFVDSPKPPPARRTRRRRDEEEEDEEEEDDRQTKKRKRRREQERAKTGVGVKVGLILGGVCLVLMVLVCAGGGLIWLATNGGAPKGGGGNVVQGGNVGNGGAGVVTYTIKNLPPDAQGGNTRTQNFQKGKRVVITVTNNLRNPNTDVDLYVYQGNQLNALTADTLVPQQNRNCRVEFIAPITGPYQVRVVNLGPSFAEKCVVRIEEL